ncbi:tryptophan synthase subunit alpha [Richelia intracellularis]|uniref:tryptophan synthase subunit alpha n=1 Tax=Richelia intracellularis TaxID=1164990 RepID=UPI0012DF7E17
MLLKNIIANIAIYFARLKQNQQIALIPFITADYPNLEITALALQGFDSNGTNVIEVNRLYSDHPAIAIP